MKLAADTHSLTRSFFITNVDLAGRIVTDKDRGECRWWVAAGNVCGDGDFSLGLNLFRDKLTVQQFGGHSYFDGSAAIAFVLEACGWEGSMGASGSTSERFSGSNEGT